MWSFDWLCHNVLKITGSLRRKKVSWYWLVELVFGVVISRPTTTMMDGREGEGMVIGAGGGLVTALNVDVWEFQSSGCGLWGGGLGGGGRGHIITVK